MKKAFAAILVLLLLVSATLVACNNNDKNYDYIFDNIVVADRSTEGTDYLGHPDSVLLDNGNIITAFPLGHGKGETVLKISKDRGLIWQNVFDESNPKPASFGATEETPTIYKLDFTDGSQKLIMISGRPGWSPTNPKGEGFDVTLSESVDEGTKSCNGLVWSEHENFFGPNAQREEYVRPRGQYNCIVAMASLTRLKDENGNFVDKWMGIFHDYKFTVYKTILSFDEQGQMQWTEPESVFQGESADFARNYALCEPEVIRSPEGNELAMLMRVNTKTNYSCVSFSTDEGETWSAPQTVSAELTGERHKAEYDPASGKLLISFRSIRWPEGADISTGTRWFSYGWTIWVGDYEDLKKGADGKGDMVLKPAHTYKSYQTEPELKADDDTGYAGLVIYPDGLVVATSYGKFSPASEDEDGKTVLDTYIIAKRFTLKAVKAECDLSQPVANLFK